MAFNSDLVRGSTETVVLQLLREGPMYGYQIIRTVHERTEGAFAWKEGTLYPCLHRMERAGIVASEWQDGDYGKPRKYYRLTPAGIALVEARVGEWQAFLQAMNAVLFQPVA